MKVPVYNIQGQSQKETELPAKIFGLPLNPDLIHQVATVMTANRRQVLAHTKGRGEVRGGGKKPWRQKGTGRARHGSTRSPIWIGGGVTFGPTKERVFKKKVSKKMARAALLSLLGGKAKDKEIIIVEDFDIEDGKTKKLAKIFGSLPLERMSAVLATAKAMPLIVRASRNLPKILTIPVGNLNVFDVLQHRYLILTEEALKVLSEKFSKNETKVKTASAKK